MTSVTSPTSPTAASATVRGAVQDVAGRLASAGVPSPRFDAVALLAHVLEVPHGEVERLVVLGAPLPDPAAAALEPLVARRVAREPLQHLTGRAAFRRLELRVGPGVFVPRPETEQVVQAVLDELTGLLESAGSAGSAGSAPVVVDLCTGSGAIPLAVKDEAPQVQVLAVELSPEALTWAETNRSHLNLDVTLMLGDATLDPRSTPELAALRPHLGAVDVVVSNPPYIPLGMVPRDPEVRDNDPELALYGGSADGLAIPMAVADQAARLLRPGGLLVMEHADVQGADLVARLTAAGPWRDVVDRLDLSGRPRYVLARRHG
ncbi:release factor glutamine methyltransferase [Arsenicicoccus piscis]|uniref:Release factor glutamine methyltransferase n=1 Tax=Arsenicicoccus piscis TaxID=673954 RepID=A0ABQ6HPL2_9MICO|nr:release factor glutamine methyltransferase [Arsenicicoccus piscis]